MLNKDQVWDPFDQRVKGCTLCHNCPTIRPLLPDGFIYHWTPLRKGGPPYKFILVAMEPVSTDLDPQGDYPKVGIFSCPLRFAVERSLLEPSEERRYLITNMAKCSLPVEQARSTRGFRYNNCATFLRSELTNAGPDCRLISVGREPKDYLEKQPQAYGLSPGTKIPWVYHYATINIKRGLFRGFARQHEADFEKAKADLASGYEKFLLDEGENEGAEARQFREKPEPELQLIFYYSRRFKEIHEAPLRGSPEGSPTC